MSGGAVENGNELEREAFQIQTLKREALILGKLMWRQVTH